MAEVLHVPDDLTTVRPLRSPGAVLDPATAQVVEAAVAEAEARGRREGELAGRQAAAQEIEVAAAGVRSHLDAFTRELQEQRTLATSANLEMIAVVAEAVLGRTPPDDALALLERVREAVALLDVEQLTVHVNPADHAVLDEHVADPRLELIADPNLARGEATLGTATAGAELTRRALLDAALRVLAEEGEA